MVLLWIFLRILICQRATLVLENLALRQQLAVLRRSVRRPRLRRRDRLFWTVLWRIWPGWQRALLIVSPATVVHWHRLGFRLYWRWKSRGRPGRPAVSADIRRLIRQMARENVTWGAPRIASELRLLGHVVADSTVAKYLPKRSKPPSQSWRTFLANHADCLASIDFCVVPTATFRNLYVFLVLLHDRRRVVHFGVTEHLNADWVSQQLREAFPFDAAPRYLIRDRDSIYGASVVKTLEALGIKEVVIAPRSPWQSPYVERFIGSLRRECLNHSIIINERHLHRIVAAYLNYYHRARASFPESERACSAGSRSHDKGSHRFRTDGRRTAPSLPARRLNGPSRVVAVLARSGEHQERGHSPQSHAGLRSPARKSQFAAVTANPQGQSPRP
jgi:putative transposase